MIKANHDNGEVNVSTKGSAEELTAELSIIIANLHQGFSENLGIVMSLRLLTAAMETGVEIAEEGMTGE